MNRLLFFAPVAFVTFAWCPKARADSPVYADPGTVAPQTTLSAISSGEVYGYFIQGGSASGGSEYDTVYSFLYDETTGVTSNGYFNSQTTTAGSMADFGFVNQGDTLIIGFYDQTTGSQGASIGADSSDGLNHAYTTEYAGGVLNGASIPAGLYVGVEDRMLGQQYNDFNYADYSYVLTDVTQTPEPGTLALFSTGILAGAGLLRRKLWQ